MPFDSATFVTTKHTATSRLLMEARDLIADEKNWTQHTFGSGRSYCAVGALYTTCNYKVPDPVFVAAWQLLDDLATSRGFQGMANLNDLTDHATVMEVYQEAIERAMAD